MKFSNFWNSNCSNVRVILGFYGSNGKGNGNYYDGLYSIGYRI